MKEKLSLTRRTNDQNILTSFFCTEVTSGAGEKVCVCVGVHSREENTKTEISNGKCTKEMFLFPPEQLDSVLNVVGDVTFVLTSAVKKN